MTVGIAPASGAGETHLVVDVLDVGHGSCVVVRANDKTHLIDTGPGGPILEYLRQEGISSIDTVVVSHADQDHVGGLSAIFGVGIPVGHVYWNVDSMKRSMIWEDLVYELDELERVSGQRLGFEAAAGMRLETGDPSVFIDLLAPRSRLRMLGPGRTDRAGSFVTSNSVSVVVRVVVDGEGALLVPGDLDGVGFRHLGDPALPDVTARCLVLPHHGGLAGSASGTESLIQELVEAVQPEVVLVSNGRGKYENPRHIVISAARRAIPGVAVSCTQLAQHCSVVTKLRSSVAPPYSTGWARGRSCSGSIRMTRGAGIAAPLDRSRHQAFIDEEVPHPACAPAVLPSMTAVAVP